MKFLKIINGVFCLCLLLNFVTSTNIDHLIAKVVKELKPTYTFWWTNFDDKSVKNSKYLKNYQLALRNHLSRVLTTQVNIKTLQPFSDYHRKGTLLFDLTYSAPLHLRKFKVQLQNFQYQNL